ncbi:MAG TPA: CSLREA domain-containing protein, partial [Actinomycetota bacterium]|nr:CSLREA domain-containing protein [Actinomycetota bacterium]
MVAAVLVVPLSMGLPARASNPAIVVNSTVDPGNGTCDVTQCTLREAIAKANADAGADEIDFAIPGAGVHAITPVVPLPTISEQLTIDGFTQGGPENTSHLVELLGSSAGDNADGLDVEAADSIVKGFSIGEFHGYGIVALADGIEVAGNQIGIAPDGSATGNLGSGVLVQNAADVVVGGTSAADRNVISNNGGHGVWVTSPLSHDNTVEGNFIGTDLAGTGAAGNVQNGVFVDDAAGTTIGGTAAGAGNVISANGTGDVFDDGIHGVALTGQDVSGSVVQGNFIGTDVTGTLALGNHGNGVFTTGGAHDTTIGGAAAGAGNLLSGNDEGIVLFSPAGTVIQGNRIGTTADGKHALPNRVGIGVEGSDVTIGGTADGAGNVISGNTARGIDLQSNRAVIQGNLIGTTADGLHALGNGTTGVYVGGAESVVIGGSVPGAGNVIAASGDDGINLTGDRARILGNSIGTDRSGARSLGNGANGIELAGTLAKVGGTSAASGNLIKHNGGTGVVVVSGDLNLVRHDLITANGGLAIDLGGDGVTPNDAGDGDTGANDLVNFPVVRSAVHRSATKTDLGLSLRAAPNQRFALDV